jgi:hypothetical protein
VAGSGLVSNGRLHELPPPEPPNLRAPINIVLDPARYHPPPGEEERLYNRGPTRETGERQRRADPTNDAQKATRERKGNR